jgi:hypothetical protein
LPVIGLGDKSDDVLRVADGYLRYLHCRFDRREVARKIVQLGDSGECLVNNFDSSFPRRRSSRV